MEAYIVAQAVLLNAEIAMYQAANQERILLGQALMYKQNDFEQLISCYGCLRQEELLRIFGDKSNR